MASGWVHIPRAPSFSMAKQFSVSDVSKQINLNTPSFLLWLTSYKVCFGYATYHFFFSRMGQQLLLRNRQCIQTFSYL